MRSDRELTAEALRRFLSALDKDEERAAHRYELLRRKLSLFFERRGDPHTEDLADETLNRIIAKIGGGETIREVGSYIFGVARMVHLEARREVEKASEAAKSLSLQTASPAHDERAEVVFECFDRCLRLLIPDERELITGYYQGDGRERITRRKEQAARLGVPPNTLRLRAYRIRARIEQCVLQCLEDGEAKPGNETARTDR